jgi:hypothetical protein
MILPDRSPRDFLDHQAGHGQHDHVRLRGGVRRRRRERVFTRLRDEFLHFVAFRVARSVDDRVPLRRKLRAERTAHVAGADDGDSIGEPSKVMTAAMAMRFGMAGLL